MSLCFFDILYLFYHFEVWQPVISEKGIEGIPAFIGLPGEREKTERGRELFERSEFHSPRRRPKRKARIPDNQWATFFTYFFAAGKK